MTPTSSAPLGVSPKPGTSAPGFSVKKEPEIVVIPDKFHGVALKLKVPPLGEPLSVTSPKPPAPTPLPKPAAVVIKPPEHSSWPMILVILLMFLAVGGVFAYLNRGLLFKGSAPVPVVEKPVPPPSAPVNVAATVSASSVSLSWVDTAGNETGFRIERQEDSGTFLPLTNVSANSTVFLDVSVQPDKTYAYRLVAVNNSGESSPSNVATVTTAAATVAPVATSTAVTLPPGGLDSDSDGISDLEEPLYGTDVHNPDTDNDGFLDGNEVFHLYNPAAKAPVRLIDAGLVKTFAASVGWSMYVPASWVTTLSANDGTQATITTLTGEKFSIALEDNPQHLPLMDWYLAGHPGVLSSDIRTFHTKGGLEGLMGIERLDAYFAWGDHVFRLDYDLAGKPFVNYRTTYEMMLNSLHLAGAPVVEAGRNDLLPGPGALVPLSGTSTSP